MLQITGSVGQGGVNRPADVRRVQQALNLVPCSRGGPDRPLVEDALVGPITTGAICRFQHCNFGWQDGRIDANANTVAKLGEVVTDVLKVAEPLRLILQAQLGRVLEKIDPAELMAGMPLLSPFRLAVLAVALGEMVPRPYGAVNDYRQEPAIHPLTGEPVLRARFGWRRLEEYIDTGFPTLRPSVSPQEFYRGLITPNARINMGSPNGKPNPLHWCGVFAAWVFLQHTRLAPFVPPGKTLRRVVWTPGRLGMKPSPLSWAQRDWANQIKPGDICNIQEDTHHFLILSPAVDGKFLTINSNSMYKGNEVKERSIDLVKGWYSADDFLA